MGVCTVGHGATADQPSAPGGDLIKTMLKNEDAEAAHKGQYIYVSKERSDRTGGRLWTERVAETKAGKIRMLIAEDGQPLSPARAAAERERLGATAADPGAFERKEQGRKDDEQHALHMLDLLPKAFVFSNARPEGSFTRIDFQPNPSYTPQSLEERVLHAMSGSLLVDPSAARLHELKASLPKDVGIGFGLLATIHAGSSFSTVRNPVPGNEWKTAVIDTNIMGRAILLKSIGRQEHVEHSQFRQIPDGVSVAQAVQMLEQ